MTYIYIYVCIDMYIIYCMHLCIHVNQCQRNPGALRSHWWGWSYDMQLAKDQDHTSNRGRIHYRVDDHLSSGENMFHTETVLPPGNVWVLGRINGINTYDASLPIIWPYLFVQKKISFLYIAISSITSIYFLHSAGWSPDFFLLPESYGLTHATKWRARHWTFTTCVWMNWFCWKI